MSFFKNLNPWFSQAGFMYQYFRIYEFIDPYTQYNES